MKRRGRGDNACRCRGLDAVEEQLREKVVRKVVCLEAHFEAICGVGRLSLALGWVHAGVEEENVDREVHGEDVRGELGHGRQLNPQFHG